MRLVLEWSMMAAQADTRGAEHSLVRVPNTCAEEPGRVEMAYRASRGHSW